MKTRGTRTAFLCQVCGYQAVKWLGRCPDCGGWNSLVEEKILKAPETAAVSRRLGSDASPVAIDEIAAAEEGRLSSGSTELDRVLGGGFVPGSIVLIGGDPGIGKSTLLLQTLYQIALQGTKILYVSGEESAKQIRLRAERLMAVHPNMYVVTESSVERILVLSEEIRPGFLAVDSIQTVSTAEIGSAPGSVAQVRESAARLMVLAKETSVPVILVGHVTKDGLLAGPRVLEHMVDAVLYFEGDRGHPFRIVRTVKNRYGSTNEIGVFEMKDQGLLEVTNPSEVFLAERPADAPGSVVVPCLEGTRPILVEVQALVSPAGFGMPRRTAIGMDPQRISLLVAVLEKRLGLSLHDQDIYVNIAGGIRIEEPAVDLGAAVAIASSFLDKPIDHKTVVFGEIGLAGEVRAVSQVDIRLAEAARLGFSRCILPRSSLEQSRDRQDLALIGVSNLQDVMENIV